MYTHVQFDTLYYHNLFTLHETKKKKSIDAYKVLHLDRSLKMKSIHTPIKTRIVSVFENIIKGRPFSSYSCIIMKRK